MKKYIILLSLIPLVIILILSYNYFTTSNTVDEYSNFEKVPEFEIETIFGNSKHINDFDNNVILVHFWASWCPICVDELPYLTSLVEDYNGSISLIAISINDSKESVYNFFNDFVKKQNPNIYWVWDKDKTLSNDVFNTFKVPETYIVYNNKIVQKITGRYEWKSKEAQLMLNKYISSSKGDL